MKKTLLLSMTVFAVGILAISNLSIGDQITDIGQLDDLVPMLAVQEEAPAKAPAASAQEQSPSDGPTLVTPDSVLVAPATIDAFGGQILASPAGRYSCNTCCCTPCCCSVPVTLCLVEPCCGCSYEVCVHLPPCCLGVAPIVQWREGILGRQIADLCWPCCNKKVKVVIPVFGNPRVWE